MNDKNVVLFTGAASLEYKRVREVTKAGTHQIVFVDYMGNTITSILPYLIFEESANRLSVS